MSRDMFGVSPHARVEHFRYANPDIRGRIAAEDGGMRDLIHRRLHDNNELLRPIRKVTGCDALPMAIWKPHILPPSRQNMCGFQIVY